MMATRFSRHLLVTFLVTLAVVCVYGNAIGQTPGYWKNHATAGTQQYDATWDMIGGPGTEFLFTGTTWLEELNTPPVGSAFHILAHQYIAAYLNLARGDLAQLRVGSVSAVSGNEVTAMVQTAETMLMGYKLKSVAATDGEVAIRGADREEYISLAGALDEFNNWVSDRKELLEASPGVLAPVPMTWGQLKSRFAERP